MSDTDGTERLELSLNQVTCVELAHYSPSVSHASFHQLNDARATGSRSNLNK
jgi:hypothetical protein